MADIEAYKGFAAAEPESRFVAQVDGEPALMIEFLPERYQIYGPRPTTPRALLTFGFFMASACMDMRGIVDPRDIAADLMIVAENNEVLRDRQPVPPFNSLARTEARVAEYAEWLAGRIPPWATYIECSVKAFDLDVWSDLGPTEQPRAGVALRDPLPDHKMVDLQQYSRQTLSDSDLADIYLFVNDQVSRRYV